MSKVGGKNSLEGSKNRGKVRKDGAEKKKNGAPVFLRRGRRPESIKGNQKKIKTGVVYVGVKGNFRCGEGRRSPPESSGEKEKVNLRVRD